MGRLPLFCASCKQPVRARHDSGVRTPQIVSCRCGAQTLFFRDKANNMHGRHLRTNAEIVDAWQRWGFRRPEAVEGDSDVEPK